jgi:hypothetical protein
MQGTLSITVPGVVTTASLHVFMMTWVGSGSVGDSLTVVDNSGRDVIRFKAPQLSYDLSLSFGERTVGINGINVLAIGSGTLTIYYR